jgi:molybdopterin synthase sulfur carrier subunit
MKLLYFARVKQMVGNAEEEVELPEGIATVGALIEWLKSRDEGYAHAFADLRVVRAAINQAHVQLDAPLEGAHEIAFFPPVTGG